MGAISDSCQRKLNFGKLNKLGVLSLNLELSRLPNLNDLRIS